jgi:hypothetical protein
MSSNDGMQPGWPMLGLAALNLLHLRPRLFADLWMERRILDFDNPSTRALCLMRAIRRPDPQAVRILLGLGASPNALAPGGVQKMGGFDGEIPPLHLAANLLVLTRDDEGLRRKHMENIVSLALAGANLDVSCFPDADYTLRCHMDDRCSEALAAIEVAQEAHALRALLDEDAPAVRPQRV